jgi:hypothetical protein
MLCHDVQEAKKATKKDVSEEDKKDAEAKESVKPAEAKSS